MFPMNIIPIPLIGFSDPISSWTHLLSALVAFAGVFFLCSKGRGSAARMTSLLVFSVALIFLFSMSGVFHLLPRGSDARDVLQRLDHAGIWMLIAGTFTPIHVILFRGPWRWAVLGLIWILAITGMILEVVFFSSFPEALLLSFFLGLGWMGTVSGGHFIVRFNKDRSVRFLIGGGVFYSLGAVIDFLKWPNPIPGLLGPHEIFHFFVILGALSHWIFIYQWCDQPVANQLIFSVHIYPDQKVIARAIGDSLVVQASSVEELKHVARAKVNERYHPKLRPQIILRYFEEEIL